MATRTSSDTNKVVRIPSGINMAHNPFTFGNTESPSYQHTLRFLKYGGLLINGLAESYEDHADGKVKKRWIPRPILMRLVSGAPTDTPLKVSDNIRGVYTWSPYNTGTNQDITFVYTTEVSFNGAITAVLGYEGLNPGGDIVTGLGTTSDIEMGGTEYTNGTTSYFVLSNGAVRPYYYTTAHVTGQISDADCPSGTGVSPFIASLDGALFIASEDRIHNSEFASLTNWPGYYRSKEQYPHRIHALVRHHNSLVAFSENSTEFFFNAGYSGTSPLNRQESFASRVGLYRNRFDNNQRQPKLWTTAKDSVYFIGNDANVVTRDFPSLFKIENFKISKISSPYIDKLLGYTHSQTYLYPSLGPLCYFKVFGHDLLSLVVRVKTAEFTTENQTTLPEYTLIYDIGENNWSVWTGRHPSTPSTKSFNLGESSGTNYSQVFPLQYITNTSLGPTGFHSGLLTRLLLRYPDITSQYAGDVNGSLTAPVYQDICTQGSPADIDFLIRYPTLDFGSMKEKYISKAFITGLQNLDSGTPADINMYVFNNVYKESTGSYPTAIAMRSYDDSMANNLSTGRKFIIEKQWSGGTVTGMDSLELHVVEGEN